MASFRSYDPAASGEGSGSAPSGGGFSLKDAVGDVTGCDPCTQFCACCCCCIMIITIIVVAALYCGDNVRETLNKQSGFVNDHLSRIVLEARPDLEEQMLASKLWYYNEPALNWTSCERD